MLPENHRGLGDGAEEIVGDHRPCTRESFFRGLKDRHDSSRPLRPGCRQVLHRADQPGDVHIVTAGMHDLGLDTGRIND
jgi:hypothetical protein